VVVERLEKWAVPPPIAGKWQYADGRISIFYSDGRFTVIDAVLGRFKHGGVVVIWNNGYNVGSGCWTANGRSVVAVVNPVYLEAQIVPPPSPQTLTYRTDQTDFSKPWKFTSQDPKVRGVEETTDTARCLKIAEDYTKEFESTSHARVWSCAKP
jgi:hypothetical protein